MDGPIEAWTGHLARVACPKAISLRPGHAICRATSPTNLACSGQTLEIPREGVPDKKIPLRRWFLGCMFILRKHMHSASRIQQYKLTPTAGEVRVFTRQAKTRTIEDTQAKSAVAAVLPKRTKQALCCKMGRLRHMRPPGQPMNETTYI